MFKFTPLAIKGCVFWSNSSGITKYEATQRYSGYRPKRDKKGLLFNNSFLTIENLQIRKPLVIFIAVSSEIKDKTVLFKTDNHEFMIVKNRLRYSDGNAIYLDNVESNGVYVLRDYKSKLILDYNQMSTTHKTISNKQYNSTMFIGGYDNCKFGINGYLHDMIIYESSLSVGNVERVKKYLEEKWQLQ